MLISSFDHEDLAAANLPGRNYALGILTWTPLYRIHEYATTIVCVDTVHASAQSLGSESVCYRRDPTARSLRGEVSLIKGKANTHPRIHCQRPWPG